MTRFEFGRNWADYAARISDAELNQARQSFQNFSGVQSLRGLSFLDIGCGSGVHSWAAHQLGASRIVSFDRDSMSTDTCRSLKEARAPDAREWTVLEGNVLSRAFLTGLGTFDYVYAWGVLHHTGRMWTAIEQVARAVAPAGRLHVALYNRHWMSPIWKGIKWTYGHLPPMLQRGMLSLYATWEEGKHLIRHGKKLPETMNERGMLRRNDLRDWLGGYPYEYAAPEEVLSFLGRLGFRSVRVVPNTGTGCSEFLFERTHT